MREIIFLVVFAIFPFFSHSQHQIWLPKSQSIFTYAPIYCSEWLDQCVYSVDTADLVLLHKNAIDYQSVATLIHQKYELEPIPGFALEQIQGLKLTQQGYNGKGVKIGIIDGGFLQADRVASLSHFFDQNLVAAYRDFITPELEPYGGTMGNDDIHGTEVWTLIGGLHKEKNIQYGLATAATYYLARTDHGGFEKRIEEYKLIEALEWMHAEGVRLVNISLGYTTDFTNPAENYQPHQMDGKTTMVTRAVDSAFYAKDMLVVVAAGNDGDNPKWRVLSAPADAQGALTVGATKLTIWEKMNYSSIGTPDLAYVKPEISCFAGDGTSFSAPIVTGLAAALWQKNPEASAADIKDIIMRSGHHFPYPNNYVGYGVPIIDRLINMPSDTVKSVITITPNKGKIKVEINNERAHISILHKTRHFHVVDANTIKKQVKSLKLKRGENITNTTILADNKVWEVVWQ